MNTSRLLQNIYTYYLGAGREHCDATVGRNQMIGHTENNNYSQERKKRIDNSIRKSIERMLSSSTHRTESNKIYQLVCGSGEGETPRFCSASFILGITVSSCSYYLVHLWKRRM